MSHALKTFLSSTYYRAEFGRSSSDCAGVDKEVKNRDAGPRILRMKAWLEPLETHLSLYVKPCLNECTSPKFSTRTPSVSFVTVQNCILCEKPK